MHRNIWQNHLVFNVVRGPVSVGVQDELGPVVHRSVAGRYYVNPKILDPGQMPLHILPKRHHYLGIVPLGGLVNSGLVSCVKITGGQM